MTSPSKGPTKWGIVSCGQISHDWAVSVSTLPASEHSIMGVTSRNVDTARAFANEHGIPKYFATYEELLQDPEIEVVYIASIHSDHSRMDKLVLENGKHVLCELPLGLNVRETEKLIQVARQKKLFLMEAMSARFTPAYQKLKDELTKGTAGDIYQLFVAFGFKFEDGEWRLDAKACGGSTTELGTGVIQFITLIFNGETPEKIVAAGHINDKGADHSASAILLYSEGRNANISITTLVDTPCQAIAIGTKGTLQLPSYMCFPSKLVAPNETFEFECPKTEKRINYPRSTNMAYECIEVRRCIKEGLLASPEIPWRESLLIAQIKDTIRKQIGVQYPQDQAP